MSDHPGLWEEDDEEFTDYDDELPCSVGWYHCGDDCCGPCPDCGR